MNNSSSELIMESNSMVSATVGRVITTLLEARPKKLQDAITRLDSPPIIASLGVSLEDSLWFLHKYIQDTLEKDDSLDLVLIPMIQHSLKLRESKKYNHSIILLNWLFQDEMLFQGLTKYLSAILSRKHDHFIALGWCTLAQNLIEYEITMNNFLTNGIRDKYDAILKNFSSCIKQLLTIISNGSILQGEFELPTRLSLAAADCILSLSVSLTKVDPTETKKKSSSHEMEMKNLLWTNLTNLIILLQKLISWNRKSRPLHVKGLEKVYKWLLGTKQHYEYFWDQSDIKMMESGILLLSSCWKHYGNLLRFENRKFSEQFKELLEQYLSGIQFYAENYNEDPQIHKNSGKETIKFFMNCLTLLLGRLNEKQFENTVSEYGSQLCQALISQLRSDDEEVIDGAISIFKVVICGPTVCTEMGPVLPLLLPLLDERDGASKAVVKLVAEYFSICSDSESVQEILSQLFSGNISQRKNGLDIIYDLIHILNESANIISPTIWQDLGQHLLDCLSDEESVIQTQASNLIPLIDPLLVLHALVRLIYSSDENIQLCASNTFISVLKNNKHKPELICMLLDYLSKNEGINIDIDRVLKLVPEWSKVVEKWDPLINALLEKMFVDPTNAVIVRFLSYISEYMADSSDLVFNKLLLYTQEKNKSNEFVEGQDSLFTNLCPLLVIRLLPLRVFDNLNSSLVYGQLDNVDEPQSIVTLLINRAFNKFQFEDVRKLAAELCGRIYPHILIPLITTELESATNKKDILKIKTCLFSICTSLMIRGKDFKADINKIRNLIETILYWPSSEGDEVSKAQHGCIDCLALMICTEIQYPKAFNFSVKESQSSVYTYVINGLIQDKDSSMISISFRLCMANVLRSTCQKILDFGKKPLARKILPSIINSVQGISETEIRAACVQVLFSVVYHLKSGLVLYSSELLRIALWSLREGSDKEKLAGTKLLASLLASEEKVITSIAEGLVEARVLLESIYLKDSDSEIRDVCQKLLRCIISP